MRSASRSSSGPLVGRRSLCDRAGRQPRCRRPGPLRQHRLDGTRAFQGGASSRPPMSVPRYGPSTAPSTPTCSCRAIHPKDPATGSAATAFSVILHFDSQVDGSGATGSNRIEMGRPSVSGWRSTSRPAGCSARASAAMRSRWPRAFCTPDLRAGGLLRPAAARSFSSQSTAFSNFTSLGAGQGGALWLYPPRLPVRRLVGD